MLWYDTVYLSSMQSNYHIQEIQQNLSRQMSRRDINLGLPDSGKGDKRGTLAV